MPRLHPPDVARYSDQSHSYFLLFNSSAVLGCGAVAAAVDVIVVAAPMIPNASAAAVTVDEMVALLVAVTADIATVAVNCVASSSCHGQYFISSPSGTLFSSLHFS